jgi:hypothetical protein
MSKEIDIKDLDKRIKALEDNLNKKEKVPRKESEYNKFMKKYITDEKANGSTKSHKDLFSEGAKAWSQNKNN